MPQYLLLLMSLLAVGFAGVRIATTFKIPHSVFLVIFGVASGLFLREHSIALGQLPYAWSEWFPDLVFYVLLPPLIFESSFHLDPTHLKRDLVPITTLAVLSLLLSTLCVGIALHLIFHLELLPSLTFGALISATDPIAVVSLFKEVGAPRRLSTLIEGESLLNDGTAMVLFRTFLALSLPKAGAHPWYFYVTTDLILAGIGSVAFGLLFSFATRFFLRAAFLSGAAQIGVTFVSAYLSFIIADHYLHLSGVIATLVVGLILGHRARLELNPAAFAGIRHIWEFLALAANTLVFFAVGFSVNPAALLHIFRFIPLTLVIVYLARAISVYGVVPLINRTRLARPISWPYQTVLVWGGLRGGLALGLVLTLPPDYFARDLFISLATAIVISTLLLNAVTTGRILAILRLDQLEEIDKRFYIQTLSLIRETTKRTLNFLIQAGEFSPQVIRKNEDRLRDSLWVDHTEQASGSEIRPDDNERCVVLSRLMAEQQSYDVLLEDGTLSKGAYSQLTQWVSQRLDAYQERGLDGLIHFDFITVTGTSIFEALPAQLSSRKINRLLRRLTTEFETLLSLKLALDKQRQQVVSDAILGVYQTWTECIHGRLTKFYEVYAHYGAAVQSIFISSAIHGTAQNQVNELAKSLVISPAVAVKIKSDLDRLYERTRSDSTLLLRPSLAYLVGRLPFFQDIPRALIRKIADSSRSHVYGPGRVITRESDHAKTLFVVVAGVLEARSNSKETKKLLQGDYMGEETVLGRSTYRLTTKALVTTELLEIDLPTLRSILHDYPQSLRHIQSLIGGP